MKWLARLFILFLSGRVNAAELSFNRDVRPILSDKCYYCHGADQHHRKADRRLDTREGALEDIDGVKAIVPGKPEQSEIITRIFSTDASEVMPTPKSHKTLLQAEKDILRRWVTEGALYEPHWAFVAPTRPAVPKGMSAIDFFVGQTLRTNSMGFSPIEDPGTLIRRVTFDLTGLPPTPKDIEVFERESANPDAAYAHVVTRLMASPRFGERMAMDWLDAARYADTNGYQGDALRMNWPWRDWVVRAFNANMPFDQFTTEQLAGDLVKNPTQAQLIATAFNRNHMLNAEGGSIPEENRTKNVFDRVETTGTVWLGLTMNCTQCHDHKFDPLTQRDYYGMFALFNQLAEPGGVDKRFGKKSYSDSYDSLYMLESPFITMPTTAQAAELVVRGKAKTQAEESFVAARSEFYPRFLAWVQQMRADPRLIEERLQDEFERRAVSTATLDNYKDGNTQRLLDAFFRQPGEAAGAALKKQIDDAKIAQEAVMQTVPHVMVMRDEKPRKTYILKRGNYETPGEVVSASMPAFLPALKAGSNVDRLALARWFVAPEQPLMARVTVNRFWQIFFGVGLVKTPDDFGMQGALPSHPDLLNWLAVEFRESGWDVKHLVRLIVESHTYRQSAKVGAALYAKDPDNVLLARGPRFRLDSRFIRDQALALSGLLVEKMGGPAVSPYQPPGIVEEMSFGKNRYFQGHGEDLYRRSLYTFWRRSAAPANFFDVPARQFCLVKPSRTSTPLHALTTLNDTTYVEAARVWATRLSALPNDNAKLRNAFVAATAREPDARELAGLKFSLEKARYHFATHPGEAQKLIASGESPRPKKYVPAELAAWTTICLLVLNLDETLTR